jgi:hypothetical protein
MRYILEESVPAFIIAGTQSSGVDCAIGAPNCHLVCQKIIPCAIMTLIQRNRFLNQFWRANRFDSTGFVFNQVAHPYFKAPPRRRQGGQSTSFVLAEQCGLFHEQNSCCNMPYLLKAYWLCIDAFRSKWEVGIPLHLYNVCCLQLLTNRCLLKPKSGHDPVDS